MKHTALISFLSAILATSLLSCGGGQENPSVEKEFRLADVKAEDVRNVGMGIQMTGDTTGMSRAGEHVYSPDSSKVVYCKGNALYIADADGTTHRLLHENSEDAEVTACFGLRWSPDGKEVSFTQATTLPDSQLQLMTVTITLGRNRTDD